VPDRLIAYQAMSFWVVCKVDCGVLVTI